MSCSLRFVEAWRESERCSLCGDFQSAQDSSRAESRGTDTWIALDMSRSCWDLDVQRLCDYLRTERPVLLVGSPKCKAFMDLRPTDRRDPQFSKTLEAGLSHLKSLMEIYRWQNGQGRWFLQEYPHHSWSQNTKALRTLQSLSGVRVTKTKLFGAIMINCSPIVEELESSSTYPGESPVLFATSVLRLATNTGRSYWSHRQYRSCTDCGGGLPCAEACR